MSIKLDADDYATIRLTHHATASDRRDQVRRHPGRKANRPECLVVGHSWTEEPGREGGSICMTCQVVRLP